MVACFLASSFMRPKYLLDGEISAGAGSIGAIKSQNAIKHCNSIFLDSMPTNQWGYTSCFLSNN